MKQELELWQPFLPLLGPALSSPCIPRTFWGVSFCIPWIHPHHSSHSHWAIRAGAAEAPRVIIHRAALAHSVASFCCFCPLLESLRHFWDMAPEMVWWSQSPSCHITECASNISLHYSSPPSGTAGPMWDGTCRYVWGGFGMWAWVLPQAAPPGLQR